MAGSQRKDAFIKTTPRRDSFACMMDDRYSDTVCHACGVGIRYSEATEWNKNEQICYAECMGDDVDMEQNIPADIVTAELIVVTRLPAIDDRLQSMKSDVDVLVLEGLLMVCKGETIQSVKSKRSEARKEYSQIKDSLKDAEEYILETFAHFELRVLDVSEFGILTEVITQVVCTDLFRFIYMSAWKSKTVKRFDVVIRMAYAKFVGIFIKKA